MYSTILSSPDVDGKVLDLSGVHDYAYVLLGEVNYRISAIRTAFHCDRVEISWQCVSK